MQARSKPSPLGLWSHLKGNESNLSVHCKLLEGVSWSKSSPNPWNHLPGRTMKRPLDIVWTNFGFFFNLDVFQFLTDFTEQSFMISRGTCPFGWRRWEGRCCRTERRMKLLRWNWRRMSIHDLWTVHLLRERLQSDLLQLSLVVEEKWFCDIKKFFCRRIGGSSRLEKGDQLFHTDNVSERWAHRVSLNGEYCKLWRDIGHFVAASEVNELQITSLTFSWWPQRWEQFPALCCTDSKWLEIIL